MPDPTSGAPARLPAAPGGGEYALRPDLLALHGAGAPALPAGAVLELEGGAVRVVPRGVGEPPPAAGAGRAGPVYALPGGTLAVPTGRVLVRFGEGTDAAARAPEIRGAGFRLEQVPGYAPHAAWVVPESGEIGEALRGIDRLRGLAGVEQVEPQMLSERAPRG